MEITRDNLINHFGMVETEGMEKIIFPLKKVISIANENTYQEEEEGEEDEGELAICVTLLRNQSELCLAMPGGSILYLVPESIEQLQAFESCIESFEPVY